MTDVKIQHNWYAVIPAEILLDKGLSSTQKLLVALISNLSNNKGYCYASNSYLADCLDLTTKSVSDNIGKLEKYGIVQRHIVRHKTTKQVVSRQIKLKTLPFKIRMGIPKNKDTPTPKNTERNNKVFKNKENIGYETLKKLVI